MSKPVTRLWPEQYEGEELCPCCGIGEDTGSRYKICIDPLVTHESSCERYRYSDDLCKRCDEAEVEDCG